MYERKRLFAYVDRVANGTECRRPIESSSKTQPKTGLETADTEFNRMGTA